VLGGALHHSANTLDVGVETTLGASVREGDVVAEARSLGAHVTDRSHGELLKVETTWMYGAASATGDGATTTAQE
jgi:hypothetical protein